MAYAGLAPEYDSRWRLYLEESVNATVKALNAGPRERILDVGCGTGRLLRALADRDDTLELVGIDLSPEMLRVAGARVGSDAELILGDAAQLALPGETFDAVVSSSALHQWPDPLEVLREIHRVIRPGGRVFITDWCRDVPLFWPLAAALSVFDRTVERIYTRRELESQLAAAGFAIASASTYRVATFWGMMTVEGRK